MTLLPVVQRELRVASRRFSTFIGRATAATITVCVAGFLAIATDSGRRSNSAGSELFYVLSGVLMTYALFGGILYSSDAISREKREGTLGLLFLTDLRSHDIVFGKLSSSSLTSVYSLLASLPVLAIPLLLGGVSQREFIGMSVVLVTTLFFSLSLGLLASVFPKRQQTAGTITFLLLLAGNALGPLLHWMGKPNSPSFLLAMSPWTAFAQVARTGVAGSQPLFDEAIVWMISVAVIAIAAACLLIPRTWQSEGKGVLASLRSLQWRSGGRRKIPNNSVANGNPIEWLHTRSGSSPRWIWTFLATMVATWAGIGIYQLIISGDSLSNFVETSASIWIPFSFLIHLGLKIWIAVEAPKAFREERESGGLELTLSTPVSVQTQITGNYAAMSRRFMTPLVFVASMDFVLLLITTLNHMLNTNDSTWFTLLAVLRVACLFIDFRALTWRGALLGLSGRSRRPGFWTLFPIIIAPGIGFILAMTLFGTAGAISGVELPFFVWTLCAVVPPIVYTLDSREQLRKRFRNLTSGDDRPRGGWIHPEPQQAEGVPQS